MRQLMDPRRLAATGETTWLFRGRRPGRHLTTAALNGPLAKRGINPRAGRAAALINLARDIPPSVLSDLLGLSVGSAARWSSLSGHDWSDYPRIRLIDTESSG